MFHFLLVAPESDQVKLFRQSSEHKYTADQVSQPVFQQKTAHGLDERSSPNAHLPPFHPVISLELNEHALYSNQSQPHDR